jgi:glycosyltransferase involved in cell wall biosynthesis
MKILWRGPVFNPTGISTANREVVKAIDKLGVQVECDDVWNDRYEFNIPMDKFSIPVNTNDPEIVTIFADYPQHWRGGYGKIIGYFLHEGTKLHPGWSEVMNTVDKVLVPSEATKNLFLWNGVIRPISVVPYGTDPKVYHPNNIINLHKESSNEFTFISVNSWTGQIGDRKGTDILIKAFDEEFKEENVKLILKIGTFWQKSSDEQYFNAIRNILGHDNPNIKFNCEYVNEEELVKYYQKADCFVTPTRGEAFGLTILNALAVGLPAIVTKDRNSGHMDFCKPIDSVLYIDAPNMEQADLRFFAEGNMQPVPDKESLKKQLRYAYEHKKELSEKAIQNSEYIREFWSWERSAKKLVEVINDTRNTC